jgi:hypothetical protein
MPIRADQAASPLATSSMSNAEQVHCAGQIDQHSEQHFVSIPPDSWL